MTGKHVPTNKHVHFNRFDEVKYFNDRPSPASSISSLPSSTGPITPPDAVQPLPSIGSYTTKNPTLHPLLVVSQPRAVLFDMTQHPSHVTTPYPALSARRGLLTESAVTPPARQMVISCPELPWRITVRATNGAYVTVSDVLGEIYENLRRNIRREEFYALRSREQERVTEAYQRRYRRIRDVKQREIEKQGGSKRIDFLKGAVWFSGMEKTAAEDEWMMFVRA
ncbi:hypothetical protein CYLTODRAFT_427642 [Cylindrobasidium torrendii FP15055 ss-10]|uniref:DUF6699 domain-containing protein n=1 Tax=Cylindrobasidium torrendii FP15055 ss-10 TaxID=1314674 RepID=A0A0D7AT90_9AGAR|nr:hypothetical protein CYLTODRAFT_427642 [Cylindrobasidium torrendii FP15055 ss-10]